MMKEHQTISFFDLALKKIPQRREYDCKQYQKNDPVCVEI